MQTLKKIGLGILDFLEIGMPVLSLILIFVMFMVNVVGRYVFHTPINASYELCELGLVWLLYFSAPYAVRTHQHVCFSLLVDKLGPRAQDAVHIITNIFIAVCFIILLYPSLDWVLFMARKYTPVLHIRFDIVYFPFVIFIVLSTLHLIYDVVCDCIKTINMIRKKGEQ